MSASAAPNPTSFADQLPAAAYHRLIHTLRLTLPPPLTDNPEDLARRDHTAIARIAALYLAASEQWKDCLRLVQQSETSSYWAQKCRAQANSMMRHAQSALRLLLRMQATRQKLEADSEARDRAAWAEHCAIGLLAQALSAQPERAEIAEPPAPPPASEPQPEPEPVEEPRPATLAVAEQHAAIYPHRAALIRPMRRRRVPDNISFDPPDDDLPQALLTARTPAFTTPDRQFAEAPTA